MNFKRNLFVITSALVGALALTGCDFNGRKFSHYVFIDEIEDKHETIEGEGYIKYGDYEDYNVIDEEREIVNIGQAYNIFNKYGGNAHLSSEGNQKIIVIPVDFPDYGVDKINLTEAKFIDKINKAFFGIPKNNEYVSVGEYFNRSSYGKLKLDGKVCDKVYTFPLSVSEIKNRKIKRETLAKEYYAKVIEWYKQNYSDIDDYRIEGLDPDKNVPIYMVYTYPKEEQVEGDEENFFWAYTFSETPLCWSSYSFSDQGFDLPDAHTYIHETGHLLGLTDYYPTIAPKSKETEVIEPTSFIDMMDASVGDETGFSKMYLNWTRPTYVTDSCEISLKSFTETGDLILLSNNWNRTVFDEYYLIEFYTPTGLNTYDVSVGNNLAKLPKVPGIKVYHVDARLGYLGPNGVPFTYCSDSLLGPNRIGFAHDNNTYDNPNFLQKNYLYQLILNNSTGVQNFCAKDPNLFRVGDEIPELKFNKGGKLDLKISIETLEFTRTVLKFEKPEILEK